MLQAIPRNWQRRPTRSPAKRTSRKMSPHWCPARDGCNRCWPRRSACGGQRRTRRGVVRRSTVCALCRYHSWLLSRCGRVRAMLSAALETCMLGLNSMHELDVDMELMHIVKDGASSRGICRHSRFCLCSGGARRQGDTPTRAACAGDRRDNRLTRRCKRLGDPLLVCQWRVSLYRTASSHGHQHWCSHRPRDAYAVHKDCNYTVLEQCSIGIHVIALMFLSHLS